VAGRASSVTWGDEGGGLLIRPHGVAARRIVGVSASDIFPRQDKAQKKIFFWLRLTRVVPEKGL